VIVTGQPGSATEKTEFLRRSFTGSHKKQLEFAVAKEGLALNGVIFVGPPSVAQAK
jgi:ribosome-interacting GTPase 1